jgi:hypothetical protein
MRAWLSLIALAAAAVTFSFPQARVVNGFGPIDLVDMVTQSEVGVSSTFFPTDSLAMDATGNLYSADPNGVIFNVTTPGNFPVGPTGFSQIGDLVYAPGGLFGFSNATQTLFFFDLINTTVTYTQNILGLFGTVTGVAYQNSTGLIYLSTASGVNNDTLYEVSLSNPNAIVKGTMAHNDVGSYITDIEFGANGTLYAMTWYNRHFCSVDTATGTTGLISAGPHRDVTGMALDPVPEPASMATIGLGLAALLRRIRKT